VRALRTIGSQQTHPVILAALTKFDVKEMARLLRLLEVVIVRYLLIGGGNTGRFETTCAILARKIHAQEIKTASDAFQELKDSYPPDDDFQQAFRIKQERSNQKVQYLLRCLEQQAMQDAAKKKIELAPGDLTVEHILPKNPGPEWAAVLKADPAIVEDCILRLGNTVLLSDPSNNKAAAKSFAEKKTILGGSDLITTKAVATHAQWDRQNIDHHQAYLAKLAVTTWRFHVSLGELLQSGLKPKQQEKKS
jgi:hypothetical protein